MGMEREEEAINKNGVHFFIFANSWDSTQNPARILGEQVRLITDATQIQLHPIVTQCLNQIPQCLLDE